MHAMLQSMSFEVFSFIDAKRKLKTCLSFVLIENSTPIPTKVTKITIISEPANELHKINTPTAVSMSEVQNNWRSSNWSLEHNIAIDTVFFHIQKTSL